MKDQLRQKRNKLLKTANELSAKKKALYPNPDIESQYQPGEKELNEKIAAIFSEANQILFTLKKPAK